MSRAAEDWPPMTNGMAQAALIVVDHTPAMLAYWDDALRCRFATAAYLQWMGKSREEALGAHRRRHTDKSVGGIAPRGERGIAAFTGSDARVARYRAHLRVL